jgi:hypothetical protein
MLNCVHWYISSKNQFCVAGGPLFFGKAGAVKRCGNLITYHNAMAKVSWYHDGHCMMILKHYLIFMMLSCYHESNVVISWRCHFFVFSWQHGGVWHEKMMRLSDVMAILREVIMMKWWCYHDDMLKLSWWHDTFVMMAW